MKFTCARNACVFKYFSLDPELIRPALITCIISSKLDPTKYRVLLLSHFLDKTPKGNMEPQMCRSVPRSAIFLALISPCIAASTLTTKNAPGQLKSLLAPVAVVLLLLAPGKLFAQQTPSSGLGWSQNDPYNEQYAPSQQSEPQSDYGKQLGAQQSYPDYDQAYPPQSYGQALTPVQPLNASQLEQLVAPIALYPDALVAQVLAASTYPGQIADADQWRQIQGYASPDQIAAGADVQNWDPSVKALTAFPRVLAQMDRNLQWTTDLGNAYYNQAQDVLEAVQVMRRRAEAAGSLQSTPQQAVYYDQGYIQLMPVNPQVVYVPTYNPWTVYGEQVSPYPGFSLLGAVESFFGSSPISYGLGIAMSAFSHTPWGWLAWGLNWLAQSVLFNQSDYYSNSNSVADSGFRHEGLHAYAGRGEFGRRGYEHTPDGFRRFGGGSNGSRGQGFGRSPGRYAGNWSSNSDRGFHSFGGGYERTGQQAYSHMQAAGNWRQFDHRGYGSNTNRGIGEGYRGGASMAYEHSAPSYRASNSGFERRQFGGGSSRGFASRPFYASQNFARSEGKASRSSSSSHFFGGGYAPKRVSSQRMSSHSSGGFHMGGGGHAPKSFGGGKNFGGGHSHGGGGHSGGHGGGKHHH
jgi:hypothetical protein